MPASNLSVPFILIQGLKNYKDKGEIMYSGIDWWLNFKREKEQRVSGQTKMNAICF